VQPTVVQPTVVQQPTGAGARRLPFSDPEQVTEVNRTLDLIAAGGPFPFRQDGVVFQNREGLLPPRDRGYYHEYTVVTPGLSHRGMRRIITGTPPETWYTNDHYRSFVVIDPRRY
jgi:ribonuclease T1